MATASRLTSAVDRITTCPICIESFDDPRTLPCLHTFCLKCLQSHCDTTSRNPAGKVRCPTCRAEFAIPSTGVRQFPGSFVVKELLEAVSSPPPSVAPTNNISTIPCDVCVEDDDDADGDGEEASSSAVPEATMYCTNCGQKLCRRCSRTHRKTPGDMHVMATLDDEASELVGILKNMFCSLHSRNNLELYCLDCKINVCRICCFQNHEKHSYMPRISFSKKNAKRIEAAVKLVEDRHRIVEYEASKLEDMESEFFREYDSVRKSVIEAGKETKRRVDEAVGILLEELLESRAIAYVKIDGIKNRLNDRLSALESAASYSREILERGNQIEISRNARGIEVLVEDLLAQDNLSVEDCQLPDITITPPPCQYIAHYISAYVHARLAGSISLVS